MVDATRYSPISTSNFAEIQLGNNEAAAGTNAAHTCCPVRLGLPASVNQRSHGKDVRLQMPDLGWYQMWNHIVVGGGVDHGGCRPGVEQSESERASDLLSVSRTFRFEVAAHLGTDERHY